MKAKIQIELEIEVDSCLSYEEFVVNTERNVIKYGPQFEFDDLIETMINSARINVSCTKFVVLP